MKAHYLVSLSVLLGVLASISTANAASDTWLGNYSVNWADTNWSGLDNPPLSGDALVFDAAGSAGTTLTDNLMTPATYNITGITFTSAAPAYTINPATAGSNGFTLQGNITNSSSSAQTINDAMTVNFGASSINNTLSGGTLNLGTISQTAGSGATLLFGSTGTITTTNSNTNSILGGWAVIATSNSTYGWAANNGSNVLTAATTTATASPTANWVPTGGAIGSTTVNSLLETVQFQINSGGTLTVASGGIIFSGGNSWWLSPTSGTAALTTGLASGELFLHAATVPAGTQNGAAAADQEITLAIVNNGSTPLILEKDGPGFTYVTGPNTYTGGTIVNGGLLGISSNQNNGTLGSTSAPLTINSGTLSLGSNYKGGYAANSLGVGSLNGSTSASIINLGTGTPTLTIGNNNTSGSFAGVIANSINLTKTGTGTQILSGNNSYSGLTRINGGVLNPNALGGGGNITFGGGTLQFSTGNTQDYSGKIVNSTSAVSIDTNSQSVTFASGLASSNTAGLTKIGNGTLTLAAAQSYSGPTLVNGGTLKLVSSLIVAPTAVSLGNQSYLVGTIMNVANAPAATFPNNAGQVQLPASALATPVNVGGATGVWIGAPTTPNTSWMAFDLGASYPVIGMELWNGSQASWGATGYSLYTLSALPAAGTTFSTSANTAIATVSGLPWLGGTTTPYAASWTPSFSATGAEYLLLNMNAIHSANGGIIQQVRFVAAGTGANNVLPASTPLSIAANSTLDLGGGSQTVASLSDYSGGGGSIINSATGTTSLLTLNTGGSTTFSGQIQGGSGTLGTISLVMSGTGTQVLAGANNYTGATTISAGTLAVNGSLAGGGSVAIGNVGTLAGSGLVGGNATLSGNGAISLSGGTIGGTLGVTGGNWNGSGSVGGLITVSTGAFTVGSGATLAAQSGVNVSGGAFVLNGSENGGGGYTVASGATLAGAGNISGGTVAVSPGGFVAPGNNTAFGNAGTLTVPNLSLANSSTLLFDLSSSTASGNDQIVVTGNLSFGGTTALSVNLLNPTLGSGDYTLLTYGAGSPPTTSLVLANAASVVTSRQNYSFDYSQPGKIMLDIAGYNANLTWAGSNGASWDNSGGTTAWRDASNNNPDAFVQGDNVAFTTANSGSVSINGSVAPGSIGVAGTYTFSGTGNITGPVALTVQGAGLLTIANTGNNYTGGTAIQGGTLALGANNALPIAGTVTLGTTGSAGTIDLAGFNQTVGGLAVGTGATAASQIITTSTGSSTLTYSGGASVFGGTIQDTAPSGGTMGLTIAGGTLDISTGSAAYFDATTVNGGVLVANALPNTSGISVGPAGGLTLSGTNLSVGVAISNSGNMAFTGTSGTITLASLSGTGTANFYSPAAVIGILLNSNVNLNGTALSVSAGTQTGTAVIGGGGSLTMTGPGTLLLSGTGNSFSGGLTVAGGTLAIGVINNQNTIGALGSNASVTLGASGTAGVLEYSGMTASSSMPFALATSGTGVFQVDNAATNLTLSGAITGGGGLVISGAGMLTISTSNNVSNYSGPTVISGGTLALTGGNGGQAGVLPGTPTITVNAGATLLLNSSGPLGYTTGKEALVINGGTVSNNGAGTRQTIFNTVNMTGGVLGGTSAGDGHGTYGWSSGGGLIATSDANGNPAVISAPTSDLFMNLTFNVTRGAAVSGNNPDAIVSGVLAGGSGNSFTKTGNGILVLSGANTYAGATNINAGILGLANWGALSGSGAITFGGGTLQYSASNTQDYSGSIVNSTSAVSIDTNSQNVTFASGLASSNTAGLTKIGNGTLTLAATQSYSGPTLVNGGTLKLVSSVIVAPAAVSLGNQSYLVGTIMNVANAPAATFPNNAGQVQLPASALANPVDVGGATGVWINAPTTPNTSWMAFDLGASYSVIGMELWNGSQASWGATGYSLYTLSALPAAGTTFSTSANTAIATVSGLPWFGDTTTPYAASWTPSFSATGAEYLLLNMSSIYSGKAGGIIQQVRFLAAGAGANNVLPASSDVTVSSGVLDVTAALQTVSSLTVGAAGALNLNDQYPLTVSGSLSFATLSTLNVFSNNLTPVTPDLLMTYNTSTGTLTNVYYNSASLTSFGDILSYVTGVSGGSLEIVTSGPPTWSNSAGGSWTNPAYWTPAGVPSISSTLAFPELGASSTIAITLDGPQTAAALVFSGSEGYNLQPGSGGTLTLNNSSGTATVTLLSGTHTISAPLAIAGGNLVVSASNYGNLNISGNISDDGGQRSLTLAGDGTGELILSGTNNAYGGGTNVDAGTMYVTSSGALPPESNLTVGAGGTFIFDPNGPADNVATLAASHATSAVEPVPEPGTLVLLLAALWGAAACHRFRLGVR